MAMTTKKQKQRSYAGFLGANSGDAPEAPVNTVAPAITGTAEVGETLTVTPGTWTGVGTPELIYQWNADGAAITGATGTTYVPVAGDAGTVITVTEIAMNWKDTVSKTSSGTAAVAMAPTNTAVPTITGTAQVDAELTAGDGTWDGYPVPTFTYQWAADGTDISGATASSFTPTSSELGKALTVTVTATNSAGTADATSAATAAVIAA